MTSERILWFNTPTCVSCGNSQHLSMVFWSSIWLKRGWNLQIPFEIYLFLKCFVAHLVNRIWKIHPCFSVVVEFLILQNNVVQWPIHFNALTTYGFSLQNRHRGFVFFQGWGGKQETRVRGETLKEIWLRTQNPYHSQIFFNGNFMAFIINWLPQAMSWKAIGIHW